MLRTSERADAADDAHRGVAQRVADLRAHVLIEDLGVLVNQHERLEVLASAAARSSSAL